MNPRLKSQYFRRADWPEEWINAALQLIRTEWQRYKPARSGPSFTTETDTSSGEFASLDNYDAWDESDALELYLNSPPIPGVTDPIAYWHSLSRREKGKAQNALARMALDILSAPGKPTLNNISVSSLMSRTATSVDVERSFSHGGIVVSKRRHNLSDDSTRAATVLQGWMEVPDLVPEDQIVEMFRKKKTRGKKNADTEVITVE
ncbi:hypothetical protein C8Q76DRAFT_633211 [Earliella scabrosa]|nr:hypothetical protein C8Q76DRAFT_633211 [Earliella scabrosa]